MKRNKKLRIALGILAAVVIAIAGYSVYYVNDYYHAVDVTIEGDGMVEVRLLSDDKLAFIPENPTAGFIFYPGAKVEYTAYAPLMEKLAHRGVLCVLCKMDLNLAIIDADAADGVIASFPEVENWYISGHSMGGVAASNYLSKHPEDFKGLVLLASCAATDLKGMDIDVLSIYGSEDKVLRDSSKEKNLENIDASHFTENVITGGCHGHFGNYGHQEGDGEPTISADEQQDKTVELILAFMESTT